MTDLEDRLRSDLHDLADRLVDAPYEPSTRPNPMDSPQAAPSRSRWVGAVAAAAVVLAGAVGLVGISRARDDAATVTIPDDPSGPLFVLPAASSGLTLTNATVSSDELAAEDQPVDRVLVGTAAGDTITDFALVRVDSRRRPDDLDWTMVDSPTGEVAVAESDLSTLLSQQRGDFWVNMEAATDVDHALSVLASIVVSESGHLDLEADAAVAIISRPPNPTGVVTSVYTDVDDPGGRFPVAVETLSSTDPLATASRVGGSAEPLVAANALGWHLYRDDVDGQWNGFVWQATADQMVAVSGHVGLDEIIEVAESLEIVDESTWRAAIPNATFTTDP